MRAVLTFGIETTSIQKATALLPQCAEWLRSQEGVSVHTENVSQELRRFRVKGVDISRKEPIEKVVEAKGPGEAKAQVESTILVVNAVDPL